MEVIMKTMTDLADLCYFSARKISSSRGGGMCMNSMEIYKELEALVPLYEGFTTYGGISIREIEAMAVGLYETQDETMISQSPNFIKYLVDSLDKKGVPVIKPAGVLGAHVDAMQVCSHILKPSILQELCGCIISYFGSTWMERGSISNQRDENGNETYADMELLLWLFHAEFSRCRRLNTLKIG